MATVNSRIESTGGSMGPRKTLIIMVTVVGCIAILWPKVFYPMMVGPTQTKSVIKDHRGSGIRQERPPHLRPDTIHPAMRERGRAIPHVGSVHSERPPSSPRIVEGRPGPIPGMRPPMGAGSHQSTKSANSMGFIMPLYTIGIVSFFIYTILKLIFKKTPATPYPEIKPDTTFRNEVFTTPEPYIKRPDSGTTKLAWKDHSAIVTAIQGLISAADEQLMKIDSIKKSANNLSKETEEIDNTEEAEKVPEQNGYACKPMEDTSRTAESEEPNQSELLESEEVVQKQDKIEQHETQPDVDESIPKAEHQHLTGATPKKREVSEDRNLLKVIPMEKKAAYEPGQHSSRPGTPAQHVTLDQSLIEADAAESKCILLDANLPQKVSVAESELAVETLDASQKKNEETPVVLSGMMKLSLVKLEDSENNSAGDIVLKAKDVKKNDGFGPFGPNEE